MLCSLLYSPVTSPLLGSNILLSTLFSKTLSLLSSLNVSDQVSQPHKTTGMIIGLYILIFTLSDGKLEEKLLVLTVLIFDGKIKFCDFVQFYLLMCETVFFCRFLNFAIVLLK